MGTGNIVALAVASAVFGANTALFAVAQRGRRTAATIGMACSVVAILAAFF